MYCRRQGVAQASFNPRRKEGEWGEGPSLAITTMFCSEFAVKIAFIIARKEIM